MDVNDFLKKPQTNNSIDYHIISIKELNDYVIVKFEEIDKLKVSIENYFKYRLSSTKGIDKKTYDLLKKEENILIGYQSCLRKLSQKDYSIKQIKDYLNKKEIDKKDIDNIINKLKSFNLLNDEKYCESRINYLNNNLFSNTQIKYKLKNDGIEEGIIDLYLNNDIELEKEKIKKLVSKYAKTIRNKSVNAIKETILNRLTNLGFKYDIIKEEINLINFENTNEYELLKKEYIKCKNKYIKKYEGYDLKQYIYLKLLNKGFKSEDIKTIMEEI